MGRVVRSWLRPEAGRVTSAIGTFVALVALVMRIDQPAGMFDTVALAAVPGWPIGLLVGSYLRDRVLPQWLDMAWAIGIGTSPVVWCMLLVWCAKRPEFIRERVLRVA